MRACRACRAAFLIAVRSDFVREDADDRDRLGCVRFEEEAGGGSISSALGTVSVFSFANADVVSLAELSLAESSDPSAGGGGSINSALGTTFCFEAVVGGLCKGEDLAGGGSINSAFGTLFAATVADSAGFVPAISVVPADPAPVASGAGEVDAVAAT